MSGRPDFVEELKRRRVPRVALVYVASAFATVEFADVVFPRIPLPDWTVSLVVWLALLGLPVALALAWAFDVSGGTIHRTTGMDEDSSRDGEPTRWLGRRTVLGAAALVLLGTGMSAGWFLRPATSEATPDTTSDASVAALPFQTMSDDREDAWFADGVHDEILTQLSRLSGLRVISRTSVMGYRGQNKGIPAIASELGVRYVLEGSVRRFGNTVKVSAQLIDSRSDSHVWSEVYERPRADLFEIQADVARRIAEALGTRITPREAASLELRPTRDPAAHDLYLQGLQAARNYNSESELWRAVELFRQAAARDPSFAEAYAEEGLTHLWLWIFFYDRTPQRMAAAETAARQALGVRAEVPGAYRVLALHHFESDRPDSALAYARRLEAALPSSSDVPDIKAKVLTQRGQWAEAEANARLAITRDPRRSGHWLALGVFLMERGRLRESIAAFDQALALDSTSASAMLLSSSMRAAVDGETEPLRATLAAAGEAFGDLRLVFEWWAEHADGEYDAAARVMEESPTDRLEWGQAIWPTLLMAADSRLTAGDLAAARRNLTRLRTQAEAWLRETPEDPRLHSVLAVALAYTGEPDEAVAAAERGIELAATDDAVVLNDALFTLSRVYQVIGEQEKAFDALQRFLDVNDGWGQKWNTSWLARAPELQRSPRATVLLRRYPPEGLPAPVTG